MSTLLRRLSDYFEEIWAIVKYSNMYGNQNPVEPEIEYRKWFSNSVYEFSTLQMYTKYGLFNQWLLSPNLSSSLHYFQQFLQLFNDLYRCLNTPHPQPWMDSSETDCRRIQTCFFFCFLRMENQFSKYWNATARCVILWPLNNPISH